MPVRRPVPGGRRARVLAASLALLAPLVCHAQAPATLVIVSQRSAQTPADQFIDVSHFLASELREARQFSVVTYRRDLPAVQAAVDAGSLKDADLTAPLSAQTIHRVGALLGAPFVLTVSARNEKDGVSGEARMESRSGQDAWNTVFVQTYRPFRTTAKKDRLLGGVHSLAAAIASRIKGTPARMSGEPIDLTVGPTPPAPTQPSPDGSAAGPAGAGAASKGPDPAPAQPSAPTAPAAGSGSPARTGPGGPATADVLVDRFRRQGDLPNMIVSLRRLITERPRDVSLRRDLVRAYNERGWAEAAQSEAQRAVGLAPGDAGLRRALGDSYLAAGNAEAAIREYQEAIRLNSKDAASYVALGDAYWNSAQPAEAEKAYAAAAQTDPKDPVAHRRLARYFAQRARYAECVAQMSAAKDLTAPDAMDEYNADFASLLNTAEAVLTDGLARMQADRKAFQSGAQTREQVFQAVTEQRKRADSVATFLEQLAADASFARVQAMYAQAAALVVQGADSALAFLETQETARDEESLSFRLEAGKQLTAASEKLRALASRKPAATSP